MNLEERFWSKVEKTDTCWNWKGWKTKSGYGGIEIDGRDVRVHRVSLRLIGVNIPTGMVLDHLCRNRACVNPDNLRIVTSKENILCGVGAPAINARKTSCVRGHPFSGTNLRISKQGIRRCVTCKWLWNKNRPSRAKSGHAGDSK